MARKKSRRRSSKPGKRFFARSIRLGVVIVLAIVVSFAYVWLHIQTVRLGYAIKKEEGRLKLYGERSDALKLKVTRLKAPRRIERLVEKGSCNFVIPDERRIVRMSGRRRIGRLALTKGSMRHNL
ncbi:MAG: hypothetical protein P9M00_10630 [Candidatus Tritonobacter lacicola]|nr:hypothetical protein [Candidatus Tritonobacter lacicola]